MNISDRIEKISITSGKPLPFGATANKTGANFCVQVDQPGRLFLIIYDKKSNTEITKIPFTDSMKFGKVYAMQVNGFDRRMFNYGYELDGKKYMDIYAHIVNDDGSFGQDMDVTNEVESFNGATITNSIRNKEENKKHVTYSVYNDDYDWKDDVKPNYDYSDMIIYRIHTRGFTKHKSAKVKNNGTFAGIVEKIPYIKSLGVTTIELMPSYDFSEKGDKLNFFGYSFGHYFAPKSSYAKKTGIYAVREFKDMVKELHKNGIEIIMEFYFTSKVNPQMVNDCIRYWVMEYHIDGARVNLDVADARALKSDPILWNTKIIGDRWDIIESYKEGNPRYGEKKHLAVCHDGFMITTKKFIKSDENQVYDASTRLKDNNDIGQIINYIANHNTFSVMDMVSYERKHNEANGENNEDGCEYNYSWNCGTEGPTKKRKVMELRKKQIKNAFTMLMLSQGTPMIFAGDEICHTRNGNNNPYCQDNDINWINWNTRKFGSEIREYVKKLIAFRKRHKILHMPEELKMLDTKSYGCPDISMHGSLPWRIDYHHVNRTFAVLFNEKYSGEETQKNLIYIAFNMYWENSEFNIPFTEKNMKWDIKIVTDEVNKGVVNIMNNRTVVVPPRSIVVLESKIVEETIEDKAEVEFEKIEALKATEKAITNEDKKEAEKALFKTGGNVNKIMANADKKSGNVSKTSGMVKQNSRRK